MTRHPQTSTKKVYDTLVAANRLTTGPMTLGKTYVANGSYCKCAKPDIVDMMHRETGDIAQLCFTCRKLIRHSTYPTQRDTTMPNMKRQKLLFLAITAPTVVVLLVHFIRMFA